MTKKELKKEIEIIKQTISISSNDKDKSFWKEILKETRQELRGE